MEHVERMNPAWRSGFMELHFNQNAAAYDYWTIVRGDRYSRTVTRGATLAAALGIEEGEAQR